MYMQYDLKIHCRSNNLRSDFNAPPILNPGMKITMPCKETRLFANFLYKLAIMANMEMILNLHKKKPFLQDTFNTIKSFWKTFGCKIFTLHIAKDKKSWWLKVPHPKICWRLVYSIHSNFRAILIFGKPKIWIVKIFGQIMIFRKK